jgi:hypothetical protein
MASLRTASLPIVCLVVQLASARAWGADVTVPGEFIVEPPTLRCLGFEWLIDGDDNRNGKVEVTYRREGDAEWKDAQPLLRIRHEVIYQGTKNEFTCGNLYAGSILFLDPDTRYEARFVLTDPDGGNAERTVTAKTRAEPRSFEGGRTLHVYASTFAGERKGAPAFSTILAAYREATPGDTILIHAGVYRETFVFAKSGTAKKPIVLRGAGDGEAILLGSGAEFMIDVHQADHLWFEDLTIRDPGTGDGALITRAGVAIYGGAVDHGKSGCQGLVVRRCKFADIGTGILASDAACRNFYIADNLFLGRNPTWERLKSDPKYQLSGMGIWIGGQGHVICHNRVTDFWDGIDITAGGSHPLANKKDRSLRICSYDIYNNDIANCMDDYIETDHSSHNIRVWENRCFNSSACGLSAQPVFGGPVYLIRNVVYNAMFRSIGRAGCSLRAGFKYHCAPAGLLAYHNTVFGGVSGGPWSNWHFRNNLFMSHTNIHKRPTCSSDHNGYLPMPGHPPLNLKEVQGKSGYEKHGRLVDYDIFVRGNPPVFWKGYDLSKEEHLKLLDRQILAGIRTPIGRRTYVPTDVDLRLKPGSAAVDAGVLLPNINEGFTGKAPDLGAYEDGKDLPFYGPRPRSTKSKQ